MTEPTADGQGASLDDVQRSARWTGLVRHDAYDELRGTLVALGAPANGPAPHWQAFFDALAADARDGRGELAARAARVQRRVRDDGATYNVHAPEGDASRAWPLQLLPFIVGADEWTAIERVVAQRALLRDAVLPPSLVFAHPQYLRPAHGVVPAGGVHLHIAAFDIARGPEGRWW